MRLASAAWLLVCAGCASASMSVGDGDPLSIAERPLPLQDSLLVVASGTGLDVAPDGTVYVTDGGRSVLVVYGDQGRRVEGGPGGESGQFDAPSGVDAGSGLVLYVADAGNGRIQRFSRDFRHLGSTRVDAAAFTRGTSGGRQSGANATATDFGRPVDLATSSADELFVAEETQGVVLKWDADGLPERIIGDFGSGDGQLNRPVGLTTDGARQLYVADAARRAVLVYDLYGAFIRQISMPAGIIPRRVATGDDGMLLVVAADGMLVYGPGGLLHFLRPDVTTELIAASVAGDSLYVLTRRVLYRVPLREVL